jgi:hypothetical protein
MIEVQRALHPAQRAAALFALAIALVLNIAASIELFAPKATFGYELTYTNGFEVTAVDRGSAAARAGIVVGDRLSFHRSTLHDRIVGLAYVTARPAEAVTFTVVYRGRTRNVTLRAEPLTAEESRKARFSAIASFWRLTGFAYIAVALFILLRRPNRMTWGLFLYLVSATDVTLYRFPERFVPAIAFASDLLSVAGAVGLVIFAARFPEDEANGWRKWLDRLAIPIGVLFAIPNIAWDARSLYWGESPTAAMSYGSTLGALALILIAGIMLVAAYVSASQARRQRLGWVIVGILFTLLSGAASWARYWSTTYSLVTSDAAIWIATLLYAGAPFAIAYAVVRQRIFDISFVVSRTLVYTIVTVPILGVFALVEWLVTHVLERSGAAAAVLALTTLGMVYSIHVIYHYAEQLVDQTLFRRRHQAERHLATIVARLPDADNPAVVEAALVREPVHAYDLASADLFTRSEAGVYAHDGKVLDGRIPVQLAGRCRSLRLHAGDAVLAVPVFMRSKLAAVAVYGAHANGEDIDPKEAASLEAIGAAAGIAYDHLETARLERDVTRWRRLAEHRARELSSLRVRRGLPESK